MEKKFITLKDMGIAYRKAKADLFYSSIHRRKEIAEYEANLLCNLKKLRGKLIEEATLSVSGKSWTLMPCKIECNGIEEICSDYTYVWKKIRENAGKDGVKPEFRLMEKLSIDAHVFSALWILKVGHKFEGKLSGSARGNRLRRLESGEVSKNSLGSMIPYLRPYRKWRDDAFDEMKQALSKEKCIVTVTADVKSFYHCLDVEFMVNEKFMENIDVKLEGDEAKIHSLFIQMLQKWARETPLEKGLPVGLNASSIIANLALFELDKFFEREIVPLYYGRYVDDIILVMENTCGFRTCEDVWDWLIKRSNDLLCWKKPSQGKEDDRGKEVLYVRKEYLSNSSVNFSSEKSKVFLLSGASGKNMLRTIRRSIDSRTSEWRQLPNLPNNSEDFESAFLSAIQYDGLSVDSLRKANSVSVKRAGFALKLRDIEMYHRLLPSTSWVGLRHAFIAAFIQHVLVLPCFFDFYTFLPRVISLTVNSGDFPLLKEMLRALSKILKNLEECTCRIKGCEKGEDDASDEYFKRFEENLETLICNSIETSFPLILSRDDEERWLEVVSDENHMFLEKLTSPTPSRRESIKFIRADLAYEPLKSYLYPISVSGRKRTLSKKEMKADLRMKKAVILLEKSILKGYKTTASMCRNLLDSESLPGGLLFPVRPFSIQDLYLLHKDPFSEKGLDDIKAALLSMRGFKPKNGLPFSNSESKPVIEIGYDRSIDEPIRITVASWRTNDESWIAAVKRTVDPEEQRIGRLSRLLNQILSSRKTPHYLVFPELSIPARWFSAIAGKLKKAQISLIAGVEYIHSNRNRVHNQVWASLQNDSLGFPTLMMYKQDKQRPALHEGSELKQVANKTLSPQLSSWKIPPIINHGGFCFSILVCSELTNIQNRASLTGNVDALFVPEWNQDITTFNSLVESACLDIHAYIVQVNNLQFGDSRIRTPYVDDWERDLVRVKGGIEDYFVTGEIDIKSLREFQSNHQSPKGPFKPVPDGFRLAYNRQPRPLV